METYTIIDKAWSDVSLGDKVRWATPRFVKFGVVLSRKGQSATFDFLDENRPRALPDARWYFVEAKSHGPDSLEHLVVISDFPEDLAQREILRGVCDIDDEGPEYLYAFQLAELLNMDEKQVRRHLRRGVFPTAFRSKLDNRWVVFRPHALEVAAKRGWL